MEIMKKRGAVAKGHKYYFTGKPCKHGHLSKRYTSTGNCYECHLGHSEEAFMGPKNPRKRAQQAGETFYYTGKPCSKGHDDYRYVVDGNCVTCSSEIHATEKYKAKKKENYYQNRDEILLGHAEYYKLNKETIIPKVSKYKKKNRERYTALDAARRAAKLQRTLNFSDEYLKELNEFCIEEIFEQSSELRSSMDKEYHVDHIIPLRGKVVSGFHVWYNLQVLEGSDNCSKRNKFTPYAINHLTGEVTHYGS